MEAQHKPIPIDSKETHEKEVVLINNVDWMHKHLWPLVVELADAIKCPGMSAQSIFAFLLYTTVHRSSEIWGAFKDKQCVGFMVFQEVGPPFYSTGLCCFVYMREIDDTLRKKMSAKFPEFLEKNNLKYFMFQAQNEKMGKYFKTKCTEMGMKVLKDNYIFLGKR